MLWSSAQSVPYVWNHWDPQVCDDDEDIHRFAYRLQTAHASAYGALAGSDVGGPRSCPE